MKQSYKMVLPLILLFAFVSAWADDLKPVTLTRVLAFTDTIAHAQVVTIDTSENYKLELWAKTYTRYWLGYTLDNDSVFASGAQGDSLTLIIQHSPDGVNNWTFYDSTHKSTLAGDAFFLVTNASIRPDSVATMPYLRFIFSMSDSFIVDSEQVTNSYNWEFTPWVFPVNGGGADN